MIKTTFQKIFNNKVDALGLSVFRMCYAILLFTAVLQLFKYRNIIYDADPFIYIGELNVMYLFIFWFGVLVMLFLGLFTRTATILNYIFGVIVFGSASDFEYHVFHLYISLNFVMLFMPLSRVFSVDSLIQKLKYTNIGKPYVVDRKILEINYLIPVFVAIGLVYFDSIFYKLTCEMWLGGLGMWLPSSLPMLVWNDATILLNQEFLVKFMGYLVLIFEACFIFLFWFKRFRIPFLALGIFFHIGILVIYPIPWFALATIGVYLLMVPINFWTSICNVFKSTKQSFSFYYDAECPLCNKAVVAIRHLDVFNKIDCKTVQGYAAQDSALIGISEMDLLIDVYGVDQKGRIYKGYHTYVQLLKHMVYTFPIGLLLSLPGISHLGKKVYRYIAGHRLTERCTSENCLMPVLSAPVGETEDYLVAGWNRRNLTKKFWKYLLLFFLAMQLLRIGASPSIEKATISTRPGKVLQKTNEIVRTPLKKFFGITQHPVFIYRYGMEGYNHIFKVVCNNTNEIVPLLDDNGMVRNSYITGPLWTHHSFRSNSRVLDPNMYERGLTRYLRYYAYEKNIKEPQFTIYIKEIEVSLQWEKDFLRKQMQKPWQPAGSCRLEELQSHFEWNDTAKAIFQQEKKSAK